MSEFQGPCIHFFHNEPIPILSVKDISELAKSFTFDWLLCREDKN